MSQFPTYLIFIIADIATIVLLAGLGAVLAAKAGWKGMPVAAFALACAKALVLALSLIRTFGLGGARENPLTMFLLRISSVVNVLSFLMSLAIAVILLSLSIKAKAKAPYVIGGVGVLLGLLDLLPFILMWTPIRDIIYKAYFAIRYMKLAVPVCLIVALVLALSMKAEDAAKE